MMVAILLALIIFALAVLSFSAFMYFRKNDQKYIEQRIER